MKNQMEENKKKKMTKKIFYGGINMKKAILIIVSILLVVAMGLSLTGCWETTGYLEVTNHQDITGVIHAWGTLSNANKFQTLIESKYPVEYRFKCYKCEYVENGMIYQSDSKVFQCECDKNTQYIVLRVLITEKNVVSEGDVK